MNDFEIEKAYEVVRWLGKQASALPDGVGAAMCAEMAMVSLRLAEYRHHVLFGGKDPYDALVATATCEFKLTQRQKDLWNSLRPPDGSVPRA